MNQWPTEYWTFGAFLMHQQCWQFGRDIVSANGNLLLDAGFERTRPPAELHASSRYLRHRPGEPALCLWAFGLLAFLPDEGGIYINRYNFIPRWVPHPCAAAEAWKPALFENSGPALTHRQIRLTRMLMRFTLLTFAAYEEEIVARQGIMYRRQSLRDWHAPSILPARMPLEWRQLSWHIPDPPVNLSGTQNRWHEAPIATAISL
jgi:hypothetical protein